MQGVSLSTANIVDVHGVSLFNAFSVDLQGVPLSVVSSVRDVQGAPGLPHFVQFCANAGMPDCPASCQSGTGMKINADNFGISLVPGIRGPSTNVHVIH